MDRSTALTALLVVAGVALAAVPIVAPAEDPPDRVEYAVERVDGDVSSWETLRYGDLSDRERAVFDAARTTDSGYHNVTTDEPDEVPPLANGTIAAYDVRYDDAWYLLQVTYFETEAPGSAHLLRLGALVVGICIALLGGYRGVTA
jgi:hypothetical protein